MMLPWGSMVFGACQRKPLMRSQRWTSGVCGRCLRCHTSQASIVLVKVARKTSSTYGQWREGLPTTSSCRGLRRNCGNFSSPPTGLSSRPLRHSPALAEATRRAARLCARRWRRRGTRPALPCCSCRRLLSRPRLKRLQSRSPQSRRRHPGPQQSRWLHPRAQQSRRRHPAQTAAAVAAAAAAAAATAAAVCAGCLRLLCWALG
mmetsp:Transcript_88645/g.180706  ORF Transcript_88645/g.180706 Transcript_88645/m.180706 type:complete len:204 (+) Transcript_88645:1191-1802(+)